MNTTPQPPHHLSILADWRVVLLIGIAIASLLFVLSRAPVAQDPAYHQFSDMRSLLGIPNFFNVISNLVFLYVGIQGLKFCRHRDLGVIKPAWQVFFVSVALVSLGSSWYHLSPGNATLIWDRIPMTVAFMGLFVALLSDYIDPRMTRWLLAPMVLLGLLSVYYWVWRDDLRFYAWVQFFPVLITPLLVVLFRQTHLQKRLLFFALLGYMLAKLFEYYDRGIFLLTHAMISGHTIKHLLAAVSCWLLLQMLRTRQTA